MFNVFIFTDIEKPFTGREKVSCMLEYAHSQLNKTVQHAFVREVSKKQSPTAMQIWTWHKKFKEEGCLCRKKWSGQPKHWKRRSSVLVKKSTKKSLGRTSQETQIPPTTAWGILRKRLIMKPYKLQLVHVITTEYKGKCKANWRMLCLRRSAYWTCVKSAMKSTYLRIFN